MGRPLSTFLPGSPQQGLQRGAVCSVACTAVLCLPQVFSGLGVEGAVQEVRRRGWSPLMAEEGAPESAQWSLVVKASREADRCQHHQSPSILLHSLPACGNSVLRDSKLHLGSAWFRHVLTSVSASFCRL